MTATAPTPSHPRRGVLLTIAVVLVYLVALANVGLGILVLLSRYDVARGDVLAVSLLGAAIILFGLLMAAVASALARGSALARLLLTGYVGLLAVLQGVTIVTSDAWDIPALVQLLVQIAVVTVLWTPPTARYFAARTARESTAASR